VSCEVLSRMLSLGLPDSDAELFPSARRTFFDEFSTPRSPQAVFKSGDFYTASP